MNELTFIMKCGEYDITDPKDYMNLYHPMGSGIMKIKADAAVWTGPGLPFNRRVLVSACVDDDGYLVVVKVMPMNVSDGTEDEEW